MDAVSELIAEIEFGEIKTPEQLQRRKAALAKKRGGPLPKNSELLAATDIDSPLLVTKPSRTLSGVTVVAVMTKPMPCPGKCIYCPHGEAAQSYTGFEPAALRAKQNDFDPRRQAENRLEQLERSGHPTDKVDAIIMGGTFTALPVEYQDEFVLGLYTALNGTQSATIAEAQALNERAKHRCVGLTFEIRPDYCSDAAIARLLAYGATRVELGVQTVFDDIYNKVCRGHTVQDVVDATRRLKDSGLKVCYHLMPGLPGSSCARDLEMFRIVFEDERFKPDMVKIYPCLLAKREFYDNDIIHSLYRSGEWKSLSNSAAAALIAEAKSHFPPWTRVMRIQRDIPAPYIEAGVTAGNLRQLVHAELAKQGLRCNCIRCREIGRVDEAAEPELKSRFYSASGGEECFISVETERALSGFLRLRRPGAPVLPQITSSTVGIRELHVYGQEAAIGEEGVVQHRGIGKMLLREAERIAVERFDANKILVISGVGVRPYYHSLGYRRDGPFMAKEL